ncbi:acyl carrier protein [Umezakia ovalisporum]|jgi:acyl carrier protein|uniref:Acyl carrier protein n=2 Tax=Umezakia ovalisporum TaxID=75695 RepID=A0AA43H0A2_9CYAN|nr:acyl carrier protein [Umezakia ovalisporum]MBI1243267.1 acyl carrier protein [Nostoc sp. RI_552]MDH6058133.1 acyl carrier protein [Umezakia ovalisporum FSS-43]MDH6064280.1 acyl carrier protein [Umezakia ovalisporum FSS-62]MDH6066275.1 acyl carrier protein [Umezakia ovalisporum APH033B]MDH6071834.1 acyl carrier protein [Umezakia ovalisporum CobakiLakeA]
MNQSFPNSSGKKSYSPEEIEAWLVAEIAQLLNIQADEIDVKEPLDSYGLHSVQAIMLANKAEKILGFKLSPMLLWHYPTISLLAKRLAEDLESSESEIFQI